MKCFIIAYDGPRPANSVSLMSTNIIHLCYALSYSPERLVFHQHVQNVDLRGSTCLTDNITNGYTFLVNNYQPGDKLFIFGFSRGAFAAQALANLVARLGVLLRRDMEAIGAYLDGKLDDFKVKKISPNKSCDFPQGDLTRYAYDVDIEVVGCWDTGVSSGYEHLDTSLVKGKMNLLFFGRI